MTAAEAGGYSPLGLAYLGDAVFEQLVRERLVLGGNAPTDKYMGKAKNYVSAAAQSRFYSLLEPFLTESELAVMKRGRNAKGHGTTKRAKNTKKTISSSMIDYRRATGVEALFGYLYLLGQAERIAELFEACWGTGGLRPPMNNE
ncbi:MAG: ribonuclease III [Clostridiales bacterium]|jgi:ribonuclease-3 family protein|nr:ribonuclease III [Clostridiales bacterium]